MSYDVGLAMTFLFVPRHAKHENGGTAPAKEPGYMPARRNGPTPGNSGRKAETRNIAHPNGSKTSRAGVRFALTLVLGLATVALLSLSFAPFDVWPFAYLALVPWIMALFVGPKGKAGILLAWLGGAVFWAVNLYWLWWITLIGYGALVVYLSLYWLTAAVVLRAAKRRNWPMWLVVPTVWVALEYARAYVISGFPWLFLAHSQWRQTCLIQIADLTGQYGVSFFVAMVNGAVVDVILSLLPGGQKAGKAARLRRPALAVVAAILLGGVMLAYGQWRLSQPATSPGPVIGLVQQAYPISLTGPRPGDQKALSDHISASEKFLASEVDVVVWPETMLPANLNPEMLDLDLLSLKSAEVRSLASRFYGPEAWNAQYSDELILANLAQALDLPQRRQYAEQIADLSRKLGCPVLAGGSTMHRNSYPPVDDNDRWVVRNSVLLFDGNARAGGIYSKVHLVPFGEYVPFKRQWLGLHRFLRRFVPAVMEQLDPGEGFSTFRITGDGRNWRLATPICYEGTFARICRQMVVRNGRKVVDVLVNVSNDGWFVYRWLGRGSHQPSTEHAQHLVQYCFRAVENRVPVVRAVNTGISASIDSSCRLVADVGVTLDDYRKRAMVAGVLMLDGRDRTGQYAPNHGPQVLVDKRVSRYSLLGAVFAMCVSAVAVAMVSVLVWRAVGKKRKAGQNQGK